jgi:NhaP-type Na+/H+ or K+/H+ antiporter
VTDLIAATHPSLLIGLGSLFVLGIGAQWLAWRLRMPSILLLLIFGFLAGPITGLVQPDELLGDLLFPLVSLSVGVILFEGGLSLTFRDLKSTGRIVWMLLTAGVLVTWLLSAMAAHWLTDLQWDISLLLGAILVVSGPTVVLPLLRQIRPAGRVGSVLKWEAIVIDPIGAVLALLVFETMTIGSVDGASWQATLIILKTLLIGGVGGVAGAGVLVLLISRYWVPDYLESTFTLAVAVAVFVGSNLLQEESGLLTVTVMGAVLANQRTISLKQIIEFKENLRTLLISGLFIILAARLRPEDLTQLGTGSWLLLAVLVLGIRPLAVWISGLKSKLSRNEKLFVGWMAPRGIVAAAVASVFALRLDDIGHPQAHMLAPLTFFVIIATVAIYGLTAGRLARWLGLADPNPQGVLIVGAHSLGQAIAGFLKDEKLRVLLVDNNYENIRQARLKGVPAVYSNVLSEYALNELDLGGIGRLLAMTPNDQINSLAVLHFSDIFDKSQLYQLPSGDRKGSEREATSRELRGRDLFGTEGTFAELMDRWNRGAGIKKTSLTEEFDFEEFKATYGDTAMPLFILNKEGRLTILAGENPQTPKPGQWIISLADEEED